MSFFLDFVWAASVTNSDETTVSIPKEPIFTTYFRGYHALQSSSDESYSPFDIQSSTESEISDISDDHCTRPINIAKAVLRGVWRTFSSKTSKEPINRGNRDVVIVDKTCVLSLMSGSVGPPLQVQLSNVPRYNYERNGGNFMFFSTKYQKMDKDLRENSSKNIRNHRISSSNSETLQNRRTSVSATLKIDPDTAMLNSHFVKRATDGLRAEANQSKGLRQTIDSKVSEYAVDSNQMIDPLDSKLFGNSLEGEVKIESQQKSTSTEISNSLQSRMTSSKPIIAKIEILPGSMKNQKHDKTIKGKLPRASRIGYYKKGFKRKSQSQRPIISTQAKRQIEEFDTFKELFQLNAVSSCSDTCCDRKSRKEELRKKCNPMFTSCINRNDWRRNYSLQQKLQNVRRDRGASCQSSSSALDADAPEYCTSVWTDKEFSIVCTDWENLENTDSATSSALSKSVTQNKDVIEHQLSLTGNGELTEWEQCRVPCFGSSNIFINKSVQLVGSDDQDYGSNKNTATKLEDYEPHSDPRELLAWRNSTKIAQMFDFDSIVPLGKSFTRSIKIYFTWWLHNIDDKKNSSDHKTLI